MTQDRLVMFGVAGLAALATAGWMRTPTVLPANHFMPPAQAQFEVPLAPEANAVMHHQPYAAAGQTTAYAARRVDAAPVASAPARPVQAARASQPAIQTQPVARTQRAPVVYDDRGATVQKRSTLGSAAIIGGGAAAGAAIGAAAGGGKGAAIGAVTGGAAGLVYDRMTHEKEVPVEGAYRTVSNEDRNEGRSTAKSAAIVGGSAAAGAAVGAAAGGGKGAAIGAVGGGAAGLIYDQMTRNK